MWVAHRRDRHLLGRQHPVERSDVRADRCSRRHFHRCERRHGVCVRAAHPTEPSPAGDLTQWKRRRRRPAPSPLLEDPAPCAGCTLTTHLAAGRARCELTTHLNAQSSGHPSGTFAAVTSSYGHRCALRTDATITCWGGYNQYGEIEAPGSTFTRLDKWPNACMRSTQRRPHHLLGKRLRGSHSRARRHVHCRQRRLGACVRAAY